MPASSPQYPRNLRQRRGLRELEGGGVRPSFLVVGSEIGSWLSGNNLGIAGQGCINPKPASLETNKSLIFGLTLCLG